MTVAALPLAEPCLRPRSDLPWFNLEKGPDDLQQEELMGPFLLRLNLIKLEIA
jgi:hypothetical protein